LTTHRSPGALSPPWRKLAECSIETDAARQQVREMLARCLPATLPSAALRSAVESAILDAVARKMDPADALPLVIVSCLDERELAAPDQAGWSFFVIERPASGHATAAFPHPVIELCLYQE
jgi:hypothetical protein